MARQQQKGASLPSASFNFLSIGGGGGGGAGGGRREVRGGGSYWRNPPFLLLGDALGFLRLDAQAGSFRHMAAHFECVGKA